MVDVVDVHIGNISGCIKTNYRRQAYKAKLPANAPRDDNHIKVLFSRRTTKKGGGQPLSFILPKKV